MAKMSPKEAAEKLVSELKLGAPPVDVVEVARRLGVRVVTSDLGSEVSGLLVCEGDAAQIAVHAGHHRHRQRFSIAHELGHYVLGHHRTRGESVHVDRGNVVMMRDDRSTKGTDPAEIAANRFAAELLMPESWVRAAVRGRDRTEPITDLEIEQLASTFHVSEQAMTLRLVNLRLGHHA